MARVHGFGSVAVTCIVLVLALAACTPSLAQPTPEPKGGGGEFRVVLQAEPVSLNPNLRSDDAAFTVAQNLYNKLVTLDADYRVIPDLAETWKVSADGLTYTFNLARAVRWHDGKAFTSADVKWTFETIASGKGIAQGTASRIASIETPNANTVVIRLKEAWAPFLPTIAWYGTFILPRHIYDGTDWSKNPANEKPVGTGPFMFVEWVKGERIALQANRDYFRRGPYLDRLTYRLLKDPSQGIDLLVKGEVDYTLARPAQERIPELQRTPGVHVRTFPHTARYYIGFNLRRKPLDDVRVRRAINMAIDRQAVVDRALLGYGAPALGFYTPAIPWAYNANARAPDYDLVGAEALLDQAGVQRGPAGVRLSLSFLVVNVSPFKEIAQVVAEQLRQAGLEARTVILASAEWNARVFQQQDFDLALTDGTWGPDPDNLSLRFGSQGANQFMGYASAEFDAAVAEGGRRTALKERADAYFRAQEILARDLPLAPLAEFVQVIPSRDNVSGLPQVEARGLVTFNNYSLVRIRR